MSVDDFVKLSLGIVGSISILGISIQIMRLLGTLNATLQDFRYVTHQFAHLFDKLIDDYDKLKKAVEALGKPLGALNENLIMPLTDFGSAVGGFVKTIKGYIGKI